MKEKWKAAIQSKDPAKIKAINNDYEKGLSPTALGDDGKLKPANTLRGAIHALIQNSSENQEHQGSHGKIAPRIRFGIFYRSCRAYRQNALL